MKKGFLKDNKGVPLVITPENDKSKNTLISWIKNNEAEVQKDLLDYGAILFRGFDIQEPQDFEDVSMAIDNKLANDYLGTSPRDKKTEFVFSASELPWYYPIMQHCEMSYLSKPPRRLFFYAHITPEFGGETPICDFRKVYEQIDKKILEEFEKKGVITLRNYSPPNVKQGLNLAQLKGWESLFLTTDKEKIAEKCQEYGMEHEWLENDALRVLNRNTASMAHPITGKKAWFNHLQVFHPAAAYMEYEKIHQRQNKLRTFGMNLFTFLMYKVKSITTPALEQSMQVLFGDGTEIPNEYVQHITDVIWENLVIYPWQKGDIIAIDNYSISHGRLPYKGDRVVMVCWTDNYQ
jgi:alpha-ketoglutarate-dependent taurine dioxygenase